MRVVLRARCSARRHRLAQSPAPWSSSSCSEAPRVVAGALVPQRTLPHQGFKHQSHRMSETSCSSCNAEVEVKRFWETVRVELGETGYAILLDGRPMH